MTPVGAILIAFHLLGMALIVGAFFANMRSNDRFPTIVILIGAIIQVVSGAIMAWLFTPETDLERIKLYVHGAIGLVVLGSAIGAQVAKTRHAKIKPWFHAAGGLAFVNLLIAVFVRQYS